ncbi:hypothetical protein [Acetobacterium wieringae]|uniref:hypothetical protein n=1 Tax=Acetobacterium wieringae TaxID=52694 RepID=UPI0026EA6B8E|nr:hypothetical protein [Acetobacterium wieringae]
MEKIREQRPILQKEKAQLFRNRKNTVPILTYRIEYSRIKQNLWKNHHSESFYQYFPQQPVDVAKQEFDHNNQKNLLKNTHT